MFKSQGKSCSTACSDNPESLDTTYLQSRNPGANPFEATSYQPLKTQFHLIYLEDAATRVCFYINKRIDPGTWSISCILKDIIYLSICNPHSGKNINIFNVYNKVTTTTLTTLAEALAKLEPLTNIVVLGDFNLHHPLWSRTMCPSTNINHPRFPARTAR